MRLENNRSNEFKKWLAKMKLSYGDFSIKTGIRYNTVLGWSRGAQPREVSKFVLKRKFPDCPLSKG